MPTPADCVSGCETLVLFLKVFKLMLFLRLSAAGLKTCFFRNKIESQELRQKIVDNYHQSKVIILPKEMASLLADQ